MVLSCPPERLQELLCAGRRDHPRLPPKQQQAVRSPIGRAPMQYRDFLLETPDRLDDRKGRLDMSVLLLNQPWIDDEDQYGLRAGVRWPQIRKRDRSMPFYSFPYALACATSYLNANGVDAVLRDSIALGEKKAQALQHIVDHAYDLVVL